MRWLIIAALGLAATGCKSSTPADAGAAPPPAVPAKGACDDVDETNLQAVVECFYLRAKTDHDRWRFRSVAHQQERGPAKGEVDDCAYSDVKVAKQESVGGSVFAAVSFTARCPASDGGVGCSSRLTRTWIREGLGWRRHGGTRQLGELTSKKFEAGDYAEAARLADEWLKVDPFDVDAYNLLGFAVLRGVRVRLTADIARAVVGIDATNSTASFLALTLTGAADVGADVGESYLRRLSSTDCLLPGAVSNVATQYLNERRAKEALELLDRYPTVGDVTIEHRIGALRMLKRRAELVGLLADPDRQDAIRRSFDTEDPSYGATQSAGIAAALIEASRPDLAREWIDYGLTRDPTNADLARLLRKLKKEK